MKVLVLDDSLERLVQFRQNLIGHEVSVAETAPECVTLLRKTLFDVAFLDHDLGGKIMVASGVGTGYKVAEWLDMHPARMPKRIIIHSFNPVGVKNMKRALPQALVAPGAWTKAEEFCASL